MSEQWHGEIFTRDRLNKLIEYEERVLREQDNDPSIAFHDWDLSFNGTSILMSLRFTNSKNEIVHPMSYNLCIVRAVFTPMKIESDIETE